MPNPNGRSWLGDKWLRVWDRVGPAGDNYNPTTGAWSATPAQYGVRAASIGLNMLAPGLGTAVNKAYGNYTDTGSFLPTWMQRSNQGALNSGLANSQQSMQAQILSKNPELAGLIGQSPAASMSPVTRQQIGFPSNEVGQYAQARPAMNVPTMPTVQAETPWTGSLAGSNPFGGQYGGNLGFSSPQTRAYGQAGGSFTPYGAGAIQVAGNGWAGSDAAAGFGLGAQGAGASSSGSIALSDAIALHKKFAR